MSTTLPAADSRIRTAIEAANALLEEQRKKREKAERRQEIMQDIGYGLLALTALDIWAIIIRFIIGSMGWK